MNREDETMVLAGQGQNSQYLLCCSEFTSNSRPENWSSREFAGLCMGTGL